MKLSIILSNHHSSLVYKVLLFTNLNEYGIATVVTGSAFSLAATSFSL